MPITRLITSSMRITTKGCNAALEPKFLKGAEGADQGGSRNALFALREAYGAHAMPSLSGRTELRCSFCVKLDPMEVTAANRWADSPLATPISETVPETVFKAC
jgi:hypothetical protein